MYCDLLNKDVQIDVWKEFRDEKDKDKDKDTILKTVYKCSACYVEIPGTAGKKMFEYCGKISDEKCLLKSNQYKYY